VPGRLTRIPIDPDDLRDSFGMGVAGNFTGHLEQAGEAIDFVRVDAAASMPKGIFPWFVPGDDGFLGTFPLGAEVLAVPELPDPSHHLQLEPELALHCEVVRDVGGAVTALQPRWVAAFDDCSWRRPDAPKISHKKNWGAGSKGLANVAFAVDDLDRGGPVGSLRLACFLQRGGETHPYGVDSAIGSYSLFGAELLDWIVARLADQRGSDDTPLEDVGALLAASGAASLVVGVGASRYEPYGESTWVEAGDDTIVALYDGEIHAPDEVQELVAAGRDGELRAASVLRRRAVALDAA
jgi:hypothetical protein